MLSLQGHVDRQAFSAQKGARPLWDREWRQEHRHLHIHTQRHTEYIDVEGAGVDAIDAIIRLKGGERAGARLVAG